MEKGEKKFSILTASYNNGKYIEESIKSVINQTYKNWELIIVDDNSSDDSVKKIQPFLTDQRIKLFLHDKNLGCGATKKDCAQKASGDIFGILDSDDALQHEALSIFINEYLKYDNIGMIYSTYFECDNDLNIIKQSSWVKEPNKEKTNLKESTASHFLTFRKDVYLSTEGFSARQLKAVDKDIIYKLEEITDSKYINKPLYFYRIHDKNISLGGNEEIASAYAKIAKYFAYKRRIKNGFINFKKNEISDLLILGCFQFLYSGYYLNSIKLYFFALMVNPLRSLKVLLRIPKKIKKDFWDK